jgi:uncharacterized protein
MKPSSPRRIAYLLLVYFAIVFIGGALIAPWLYWLAQWAAPHGPVFSRLAASPFHRFVDRSLLGLALICLWPLLRSGEIGNWRDLGFSSRGASLTSILRGAIVGWASLAAVVLLAWACGANVRVTNHSSAEVFRLVLNATFTAVVVAVLEELVFRGALFGLLRRTMQWPAALIVSSVVYSGVHFIKKAEIPTPIQWNSGLLSLWAMLSHPPPLLPAFLTLFTAGAILALSYQLTGALYFSIGLHAGWIFWLKSYQFLFAPARVGSAFWGTTALIDGWLSFLTLTAVLVLVAVQKRPREPDQRA